MVSIKCIVYSMSIIFLMITALLYIFGVAKYITDFEENTCEMTYMYEYPQYVRIPLQDDLEAKYSRFGLYAYGEGFVTEKLRRMHFSGIPVLFIPGNAGSHEQVRSIASVSLRKGLKNRTPFHFDFFTISFNKDYSALYGGVVIEQTEYVSHCIKTILGLYKNKMDSVVLIGHSMGGIIAKGALLLAPDMNSSYANMIINLATPHTPALVLDNIISDYYRNLEKNLHNISNAGVTVVSIGGGPRDILVTAAQTLDRAADINVLSTSIPAVWRSTDHLSILWCKQLVFAIVRCLFDSVDYTERPYKITSNPHWKMQALSYHLLQHNAGKKLYHHKEVVQFEANSEWIPITSQQYIWNNTNILKNSSTIYLMVKLSSSDSDFLTIETINLENKDWLFACTASRKNQRKACDWGWNLTNKTRILPDPLYQRRRIVDLKLKEIEYPNVTHVVVRITPDDLDKYLTVNFDSYFYNNRIKSTKHKFLHATFLLGFQSSLFQSVKGSIRYHVTLPNILDAVTIKLRSMNCTDTKHYAIVELLEPWNIGSTQFRFFTNINDSAKTMKIQTLYTHLNETASLRLTLDPVCLYEVHIQPGGIIDKISCRVRDRWPILYMPIISLILLIISIRVHPDSNTQIPTIFVTIILSFFFNVAYETCIALSIIGISAIGICCCLIFFGSVAHTIIIWFLTRITFSTTWSEWLLNGLSQLPLVTTVLVISLIPAACGGLSMLISVFLYFLQLTNMYETFLVEIIVNSFEPLKIIRALKGMRMRRNDEKDYTPDIFNHLILFLLWCFTALPAIPSVLVWAKNFSYNMIFDCDEDPVFVYSWTALVAFYMFDIVYITPNRKTTRSLILSCILRFLSWVVLSMAAAPRPSFYHWYIPPISAISVFFIALDFIISERISN